MQSRDSRDSRPIDPLAPEQGPPPATNAPAAEGDDTYSLKPLEPELAGRPPLDRAGASQAEVQEPHPEDLLPPDRPAAGKARSPAPSSAARGLEGAAASEGAEGFASSEDWQSRPAPSSGGSAAQAGASTKTSWFPLKVWLPFLQNPHERRRMVAYPARDAKSSFEWNVAWPRQCCVCGSFDDLQPRRADRDLRTYDKPIAVVFGAFLAVVVALSLSFLVGVWYSLMFVAFVIVGGAALLRIKSWPESVVLSYFLCPQHVRGFSPPPMMADDDVLHILAPSEEMAQAAKEELHRRRTQGRRGIDASAPPPAGERGGAAGRPGVATGQRRGPSGSDTSGTTETAASSPAADPYVPPRPLRPVEDLPPIKLWGDDEEATPGAGTAGNATPGTAAASGTGAKPANPSGARPGGQPPPIKPREDLPPIKLWGDDDEQTPEKK